MSVVEQISVPSEHVTLEPGDILLTGTPAGVGMATDTYLRAGDKIEAEIEGLGKLEVEIISDVAMPERLVLDERSAESPRRQFSLSQKTNAMARAMSPRIATSGYERIDGCSRVE